MPQQSLVFLGCSFVLVACAGVFAMLELWGNEKTKFNKRTLTIIHRTCGYIFISIYLTMMYFMLHRIATQTEPLTALQAVHAMLGIMIFPLLAIKIFIVRILPGLGEKLPYFGVTIFTLALTLNVMTAGFYLVRTIGRTYVSLSSIDRSTLNSETGRKTLEVKCQKCHSLERVFNAVKTQDEWEKTVNRMASREPSIRTEEAAQILFYLTSDRAVQQTPQGLRIAGMNLTDQKCGRCHLLERVYRWKRPPEEWGRIVDWMSSIEPAWISHDEAKTIKEYLVSAHSSPVKTALFEWAGADVPQRVATPRVTKAVATGTPVAATPGEPTLAEPFKTVCTDCHSPARIFAKAHDLRSDKDRWRAIVDKMRGNGAEVGDNDVGKFVEYLAGLEP